MSDSKSHLHELLSTTQQKFLLIWSLSRELGLLRTKHIRNSLRIMSATPTDRNAFDEAFNFALKYLKSSPEFLRAFFSNIAFQCSQGKAAGPIIFAKEFDPISGRVFPVGVSLEELLQNALSAGRAGGGKTTGIYAIVMGLIRSQVTFFWLDLKRDGRHLIRKVEDLLVLRPENFKLNPLFPPVKESLYKWIQIFVTVFFETFFPGTAEASRAYLLRIVEDLYAKYGVFEGSGIFPSLFEIDYLVDEDNFSNKKIPSSEREKMRTIRNRLRPMLKLLGPMFDCSRGHLSAELLDKNVIFEFDGLAPEYQSFLTNLIFHWVFTYRMESDISTRHPLIMIFEEAKTLYGNVSPTSQRGQLTSRSREFRLGIIATEQSPYILGGGLMDNVYMVVCHNQSSPKNINHMAAMLGLNEEQKSALNNLRVGQAIIKFADRHTRPLLAQIIHHPIRKDVSTKQALDHTKPLLEELPYQGRINLFELEMELAEPMEEDIMPPESEKEGEVISSAAIAELSQRERDFLEAVRLHPELSVAPVYQLLNMSSYIGNKVKKSLIEKDLIEEIRFKLGKRGKPKTFLKLTADAEELVGPQNFAGGKGGHGHRLLAHIFAAELTQKGYKVGIEYYLDGKSVDIGVEGKGQKIAVEIGMNSVQREMSNIQKDLQAGWDRVVVIVADERMKEQLSELISCEDLSDEDLERVHITDPSEAMKLF